MKKILIFLLGILLLCACFVPAVSAEGGTIQVYELVMVGNEPRINGGEIGGFWETPTLQPGDYSVNRGSLALHNCTAQKQKIFLKTVELPYDNEEALRYLNHLQLTIYNPEDVVVYHGPYSEINNDPTFSLEAELKPDEWARFRIVLACDYEYRPEGALPTETILWDFGYETVTAPTAAPETPKFADPALSEFLWACGIAAVVLALIFVYTRFLQKRA